MKTFKTLKLIILVFCCCSCSNSKSFYVEKLSGTVTDYDTSLVWQHDELIYRNWNEAVNYCTELVHGGRNNWRLPEIYELLTIVDFYETKPSINLNLFPDANADYYWTSHFTSIKSELFDDTSEHAWVVSFNYGVVRAGDPKCSALVRCVSDLD